MKEIARGIAKDLRAKGTKEHRFGVKKYFREEIKPYGVKSADVKIIVMKYWKGLLKGKGKKEVFSLCELLYRSGYAEENFIASEFVHRLRKDYKEEDFKLFERWIKKYVSNWAACDSFCNHTIGEFLESYPKFVKHLYKWAKSQNRWVRRASVVSLILQAKRGLFSKDVFSLADILLQDQDDMVQKGYGWLLKSYSNYDAKKVFHYVMKNKKKMPRLSLRYAIEKLPKEMKKEAMKK